MSFLLFWQLPLTDKLKYFEIEDEIAALSSIDDPTERGDKLNSLLAFLGANPVQKINRAFADRYGSGVLTYLDLE